MNQETLSRLDGERRAQQSLLHLLCAVSIWRTAMTRILPLCGAAAWWVTLLCLLPGLLTALLFRFAMHLTGTSTLVEAMRAVLGKGGAVLLSAALALPLAADALASLTALITLFTQGIGTRGTPLTLALLTGGALIVSLHREGLSRGAYFLRWGMIGAVALLAAFALAEVRLDGIFPLYGDGRGSVLAAVEAGVSLAWPLTLLLTSQSPRHTNRMRAASVPVLLPSGLLLLLTLTTPHELLVRESGLAAALMLPIRYAPNALRVLALSLMMLCFFLTIGASVQLLAGQVTVHMKATPGWLPCALLAVLLLTQAADASLLWHALGVLGPWVLLPLLLLSLCTWPIALTRRKRP